MGMKPIAWLVGIIAAAAVAVAGYSMYVESQKRAQQKQVVSSVVDTTEKLRQALTQKATPELVQAIDENLSAAHAPRDPQLADAAEQYIMSAREIARRRSDTARLWAQARASRDALAGHMARSERRSEPWLRSAVALKKRVDDDYFEVAIRLKALDELLFKLPDAEKRLDGRVEPASLLERDTIEKARNQAQVDLKRANDELASTRRMVP